MNCLSGPSRGAAREMVAGTLPVWVRGVPRRELPPLRPGSKGPGSRRSATREIPAFLPGSQVYSQLDTDLREMYEGAYYWCSVIGLLRLTI